MLRKTLSLIVCAIVWSALVSRAQQPQNPAAFELDEMTVAQLQDTMVSGRYTARRLVELYTARINAIDRQGPALTSVIELNPEALSIAESLDAER
jgi:amidase